MRQHNLPPALIPCTGVCLPPAQDQPPTLAPLRHPQASTLGSLEALLEFLSSPEVNIPVSGINIGPVHKKDVLRANVMNEKVGAKERGGGSRLYGRASCA